MPPDATKPPLQCQLQLHTTGQWAGRWAGQWAGQWLAFSVCVGQTKEISFTWLPVLSEGQSTLSLAEIPQLHCAIT